VGLQTLSMHAWLESQHSLLAAQGSPPGAQQRLKRQVRPEQQSFLAVQARPARAQVPPAEPPEPALEPAAPPLPG